MTAHMTHSHSQSFSCCTAAGTSFARILNRVDTALILAVSIFVVRLGLLVNLLPGM